MRTVRQTGRTSLTWSCSRSTTPPSPSSTKTAASSRGIGLSHSRRTEAENLGKADQAAGESECRRQELQDSIDDELRFDHPNSATADHVTAARGENVLHPV
jgi:hypothetical protein